MRNILIKIQQLFFFPHIILFLICKRKEEILADLYSRKEFEINKIKQINDLTNELASNNYFRTIFYYRTKGVFANILSIFYPKNKLFIIDTDTKIGKGIKLAHPYATILNAESIGENLYINHLVTVGEKNKQRPKIGNNVELHAGCIVIGGITIGDNAVIGAGAVVVKDIPNNATVVGNPARVIK